MAIQLVTFSTKIDIPTNGTRSAQVVSDDFDGDGNKDLAVLNYGLNSGGYDIKSNISLLFGNGKGAFGQAITYEINNSSAYLFEKGDFNQDGKTDLVVASDNYTISVLLNNSKGGFTNIATSEVGNNRPVGSFTVGDFNNDGKNDLAITSNWAGGNAVLLGDGKGGFDSRRDYSIYSSSQVAAADFNGDGILDLASASAISSPTGYKSVPIMIGKGDGSFNSPVYVVDKMTFGSISTGDINGDGKVDIIASYVQYSDFSNSVALIGNGKGEFGKPLSLAKDGYFKVLDLNGDKITDLITVQGGLLIGNGDGNFSIANNVYDGWSLAPNALAVDDFNKDGKLDLAIPNFQLNSVAVLINTTGENYLPTGNVTISGNASQNQTLSASNTLVDVNGLGPVSYQWLKDGVAINAATQSTYMLTQADVGKKISVKASYTDALGTAESVISAETMGVTNVNDVPTGVVTITGIAAQNQVLMANNTLIDVDGLGTISYFWQRDGVEINAATQSTYMLTQADVGKKISVKASYTDLLGAAESVSSTETTAVANVNDAPTGNVTITGTPTQNQILTASNNLADADGLGAISYTWLRDGIAINTATQPTYTLTQADVGKKISVKASYTDSSSTAESVSSTATTAVANINDIPTGSVTISGTAFKGQILTASNNLVDTDGLSAISYTWLNNGAVIPNATQSTYKLTQIDTGQYISVKASYVDLQTTPESATSTTILVASNQVATGNATIKGVSTYGSTLSVTNTIKDADGIGKLSYTWQNDKTILSTNATYTLTDSDIGEQVWAVVSYTDKKGSLEEIKSNIVNVTVSNKPSVVNDVLTGTDGANKLNGLAGNDTLIGGLGKDSLTGGVGADVFKFNSANDSSALPKQADTITDFKHAQGDKIDVSAINANSVLPSDQAFTLISATTFSVDATGQLRFDAKTSTLYGSTNADAAPEFAIVLSGVKTLVAEDLML